MPLHHLNTCRRLQRSDFALNSFTEFVPPGLALEDVLGFPYWVNVVDSFRLNDVVTVVALDGSFDATLRIIRLAPGFIEFRVLSEWRPEVSDAGAGRFELAWAGPKAKWLIREIASGRKVMEGLDKPAALTEMKRLAEQKEAA